MDHFNKNKITKETLIFPKQEQAVEIWELLIKEGYKFMWDWVYHKGDYMYQVWYDPDAVALWRKLDISEDIWVKKQRKLAKKGKK